ncbi:MAG: right-handed parallel beta-helix repeat-containing protein [Thermodesulfobacteriota bacterium]
MKRLPVPVGLALLLLGLLPRAAHGYGGALAGDHTWSGEVRVEEDLRIPPGVVLTILSGTRIVFAPSESAKVEPAEWSPGTELAVEGTLTALGTPEAPVTFEGDGPWGGLVAAPGSRVHLREAILRGAETGLLCVGAECRIERTRVEGGEYGLAFGPGAAVTAEGSEIVECRVGVLDVRDRPEALPGVSVRSARDTPRLVLPAAAPEVTLMQVPEPIGPRTEYLGGYTVEADETWQGRVILSGRVTVVPGAVLTLAPGTRVAFRKTDTNGDGLGEGELLVLGGIRSLGRPEAPVVFESAEPTPRAGDWDKVSLIASDDPDNRLEHTVFRHGTQALHAHFSRFAARGCTFADNLRALQFQESEGARVEACVFVNNKQALRFRDSRAVITGNRFSRNLFGVHAFRAELEFTDNVLEGSALGGFLAKESRVIFERNRLAGSRDGVRMKDPGSWVHLRGNRLEGFAEDAISLSQVEGTVEGNAIEHAGLDLVSVEDASVTLHRNRLGAAGRDALHLKGSAGVDARENFWGAADPAGRIHDRADDPTLGAAAWSPVLAEPPRLHEPTR